MPIAAILSLLAPLLTAGATGIGSYFASRNDTSSGNDPGLSPIPGGGFVAKTPGITSQQGELQQQLLSLLSEQLGQGPNSIENYAQSQFEDRGLPALLHRFSERGSNLRSSGFRNAIIDAQKDLSGQLGAQKFSALQGLLGSALSQPTGELITQPQASFGQRFAQSTLPALANLTTQLAGNYGQQASQWLNRSK